MQYYNFFIIRNNKEKNSSLHRTIFNPPGEYVRRKGMDVSNFQNSCPGLKNVLNLISFSFWSTRLTATVMQTALDDGKVTPTWWWRHIAPKSPKSAAQISFKDFRFLLFLFFPFIFTLIYLFIYSSRAVCRRFFFQG